MADEVRRIEIGFSGGQVMATRLTDAQLDQLREALESSGKLSGEAAAWHRVESEDGAADIDLRQVIFVRVASGPHTIGFSNR